MNPSSTSKQPVVSASSRTLRAADAPSEAPNAAQLRCSGHSMRAIGLLPRHMLPRIIRFRDAPRYIAMDRNRFNSEVRPHLTEIPVGKQGIGFDRLELDAWVDDHKTRNGRPSRTKGPISLYANQGPASSCRPASGMSPTASSGKCAKAQAQLGSKKRNGISQGSKQPPKPISPGVKPMRDHGELPRILNAKQVRAVLGVSQTTLWRMINVSKVFPRPTPISAHRVGWREAEVRAWVDSRFGEQLREK
jgi:predicted DNA-binding transcriptional regulator AlpA